MAKYIKTGQAINVIDRLRRKEKKQGNINSALYALNFVKGLVLNIPAADVQEVKHGRWLQLSDDDQYEGSYLCSECRTEEIFFDESSFSNYCPNCGAKMDGR